MSQSGRASLRPTNGAGGDRHKAAPEYSRSEGCQHRVVGEAQPGGGGEWPGWEEEEVAEEGGEDHGPWEGGRLDGAHHGEGAGEERKILGEVKIQLIS